MANNSDSEEEDTSVQHHGGMRRVVSNSEISVAAANESVASSREYKVRKSSLIGYVEFLVDITGRVKFETSMSLSKVVHFLTETNVSLFFLSMATE